MVTIYLTCGYLVLHLLSYVLYFRDVSFIRTEKGIFVFHLISFSIVGLFALTASLSDSIWQAVTVFLAVCAAHGIYSLSFLELWSLAEGSYSFKILKVIEGKQSTSREEIVAELSQVGDDKKEQRLAALKQLRLVEQNGDALCLTARGRIVAAGIRFLRWLANLQETG